MEPGTRRHDGFFARSESGLAVMLGVVSGGGTSRSAVRAVGQSAVLSLGGTPARGLVVGGLVWTSRLDPVFVEGGKTVVPDDDSVKVTVLRLGPFVDWYPEPRRGFHTQAAALVAFHIESDAKGNPREPAGVGAALAVGAGYEWFLASQFSLGVLGRVAVGTVFRGDPAGGATERTRFVTPELSLSATYH